jgi:hypothetical protein
MMNVHERRPDHRLSSRKRRWVSIAATLDIDSGQIGGIALDIHLAEPDFLGWFYIRNEIQDIIKRFSMITWKRSSVQCL